MCVASWERESVEKFAYNRKICTLLAADTVAGGEEMSLVRGKGVLRQDLNY